MLAQHNGQDLVGIQLGSSTRARARARRAGARNMVKAFSRLPTLNAVFAGPGRGKQRVEQAASPSGARPGCSPTPQPCYTCRLRSGASPARRRPDDGRAEGLDAPAGDRLSLATRGRAPISDKPLALLDRMAAHPQLAVRSQRCRPCSIFSRC